MEITLKKIYTFKHPYKMKKGKKNEKNYNCIMHYIYL